MRIYNRWAGNPKGRKEDPARCIASIYDGGLFYQCNYKRGKGSDGALCGVHARIEKLRGRAALYMPQES